MNERFSSIVTSEISDEHNEIVPKVNYFDSDMGVSRRLETIYREHFGDELPVIHFTNKEVGNTLDLLESTGFCERFQDLGIRGALHVGAFRTQDEKGGLFRDLRIGDDSISTILQKFREINSEFYHHGMRTNKNQLGKKRNATFSMPAVLVFEKPGVLRRGTDAYDHWIVKDELGADKLLALVELKPVEAMRWIALNKQDQNSIIKDVIHELGTSRMDLLHEKYVDEIVPEIRDKYALYAHDLVDAYMVERGEFDDLFSDVSSYVKEQIDTRRKSYNILNVQSEESV